MAFRDLETEYSNLMGQYMDALNSAYIKEFRKLVQEAYGKAYSELTTNAVDFRSILERMRKVRDSLKPPTKVLEAMENVLNLVNKRVVSNIAKQFKKRKLEVPNTTLSTPSEVLKQAIKTNVDLIGAIKEKQSELLEETIYRVVKGGADRQDIIDEVENQANAGKAYAQFVAEDQLGKVYADINQERQKSVGGEKYEWVSSNDSRTRDTHRALDGKIFRWDQPPLIDGRRLNPGDDYRCRCTALMVF